MSKHQVSCIQKSDRYDLQNKIEFIGGQNYNGTQWKITVDRAIDGIESGKWEFFVQIGDIAVDVVISSKNGFKYLKTENDDLESNNLLNLPSCP